MKCNYKVRAESRALKSNVFVDKAIGYEKVENSDYCKICGGKCCKNARCIFF